MPFGSEALSSQLLVQTIFYHDVNLRLEFPTVIFEKINLRALILNNPTTLIQT